MVSSRDRITSAPNDPPRKVNRQSAAACVSLSKSTMSKTRTASAAPPFNARWPAEAAIYPTSKPVSNRFSKKLFEPERRALQIEGPPEWRASKEASQVSQVVILRNLKSSTNQTFTAPLNSCEFLAAMIGAALLMRRHSEVNQPFSAFSRRRIPDNEKTKSGSKAAKAALADPSSGRLKPGAQQTFWTDASPLASAAPSGREAVPSEPLI